ncbi:efflux RND transporter periplasmic adaptor subunit [Glaciecola siphonariae]|uniref:Efflux RND transporter periplasmic adaptor subunit n=1 Tax=Glaciecola siphonariae TaxID=521012 RepID=A0ABV9LWQ9_9ALTE
MSNFTDAILRRPKRLLIALAALCFALLALLMLLSGSDSSQAYTADEMLVVQNAAVEVQEITMQSRFSRQRVVYGQVESAKQSNLGFELAGVLQSLYVTEGQSVAKGELLASLDLARLEASANEVDAALKRAQADATLATLSLNRVRDLVNAKLEPQQRLDEAKAALDAANALVAEVEARLASVQVEKQKSQLLAPFDGQVFAQLADEGTVLGPGQAVFSMISANTLEARFGLPENTAFGLQIGERYPLSLGDTQFMATVKSIAKLRTLATRTVDAVFTIDQASLSPDQLLALVSGDLVSISVDLEVDKTGAWVPLSALANGVRGLWTVLVYQSEDSTLAPRTVSVEHLDAERAYISGAIQDGDKVVVNGTHRFTPGQKVLQVRTIAPDNAKTQVQEAR